MCDLKRGNVMDLNNLSLFALANKDMKYLTERQKVLAANVANANTPGYLAKDLEKPDFAAEVEGALKMKMVCTNEKHFSSLPSQQKNGGVFVPKPTQPLTIDGNSVVLEDQMNEISKDKSEYNRVLTLYGKYKNMIKTSLTKISS